MDSIDTAFEKAQLPNLHSVLAWHKGQIIVDKHFTGVDELWGRPLGQVTPRSDTLHDLRSISKSITSLLYGIALGEGLVPDIDAKLYDQFPEYKHLMTDPRKQAISIRDVLSMQMGMEWNEHLPYSDPNNSEVCMEMANDRNAYILSAPMQMDPGLEWSYCGGASALLASLIARGTNRTIDRYMQDKLLTPLGIEAFDWVKGKDGMPIAASGLRLSATDLVKIGCLLLNKGRWQGEQLIPESWLQVSMQKHAQVGDAGYGFAWWLPSGEEEQWFAGVGNGGQRLHVDPQLELVVVIFSGSYNDVDAWQLPVTVLERFVYPLFEEA